MSRRQNREDAYRAEAERLVHLPAEELRRALARIRSGADAPGLSTRQLAEARERAAALEWLLQRLRSAVR
jgi:hypothetical protein